MIQSQRTWETTLGYGFPMYWIGATRNMSWYHAVESALCRLLSRSADLVFESYDLMAVSVTGQGSMDSFCTGHTGYSISFFNTALCYEHAAAFSIHWGIHNNNSLVGHC